jgi:hypothetical protein
MSDRLFVLPGDKVEAVTLIEPGEPENSRDALDPPAR